MKQDRVETFLQQWQQVRPELDCSPMGVVGRLARADQLISARLLPVFKTFNLSAIEFDILATLRRAGCPLTPTELYQTLMISSGAMSTRCEQLVQRQVIERLASGDDRRSCKIALTPLGISLIDAAVEAHLANETEILSPLTLDEQQQLASLLKRWLMDNE
ncbi:MarR family winged helix-turn-helix transcriptional regulator [Shewanella sp. SR44-3]|uniref:MarR family winged helix-turn-helix transcriptional regulator n=1 Tax=Shewanella sp. SR44-3 TaxID=2760936 RepID=UPI0015F99161|nr:MarR family transcriptional regulator [Shewanella sp. SR44-3]MBB1270861.1 MarR family transcriptional regulator [Shewanella sp. SR44-3]